MCANSTEWTQKSLLTDISTLINDFREVFVFSCTRMHSMQKLPQDSRDHPLGKHTLQQTEDMLWGLECACPCGTVFCPAPNLHSKLSLTLPSPSSPDRSASHFKPSFITSKTYITKGLNQIKAWFIRNTFQWRLMHFQMQQSVLAWLVSAVTCEQIQTALKGTFGSLEG